MHINFFSVTFWFNIFNNHKEILEVLQKELNDEYRNFSIHNYTDNYVVPVITAINKERRTNLSFSQINFQYNMDQVTLNDLSTFKDKVLKIYDILTTNNIKVLHSAIFINGEIIDEKALNKITQSTLAKTMYNDDLVDVTLKIGKKHEDLFYKIVTILNKKQIKLPQMTDELGRHIPIPLISWHQAIFENEIVDISYEINDKYLFDYTNDYHTTEFYLNKMLYLLTENFESDIKNILEKGYFN